MSLIVDGKVNLDLMVTFLFLDLHGRKVPGKGPFLACKSKNKSYHEIWFHYNSQNPFPAHSDLFRVIFHLYIYFLLC